MGCKVKGLDWGQILASSECVWYGLLSIQGLDGVEIVCRVNSGLMMSLSVTWGKIDPRPARIAKMPPAQLRTTGPSGPLHFVLCPSETHSHTSSYAWIKTPSIAVSLSRTHTHTHTCMHLLTHCNQKHKYWQCACSLIKPYILGLIGDLHSSVCVQQKWSSYYDDEISGASFIH